MESKLLLKATLLAIVAHFATSENLACNLMCPALYAPVCGTDGKTYSNECFLNVERACNKVDVSVAYNGKCGGSVETRDTVRINCLPNMRSGVCTREYMPICGSDGRTYGNRCTFCYAMYLLQDQGKELAASYVGECKDTRSISTDETACPPSSKSGICTLEWNPVCGSDGKTYGNRCEFCAAMYRLQEEGKDISIVYPGQCRNTRDIKTDENGCPESSRHRICTLEWDPVCASDGNTYATKCAMCADMYTCEDEGRNNCKLTVVKKGMC